jgi:signal transduction histidine kinase
MTTQPVDALLARQSAVAPPPIASAPESPPAPRWNPGDLVLEPGCPVPSIVIRCLADPTVLLRHVGLWDDHVIAVADLRALVDGWRVRCGTEAREAVAAERARMARELHDILAYSITLMMLQTAIAKRLMLTDPEQAVQTLGDIDDQGRQAMVELRRMLAALRVDGAADDERPGRGEHRGLADLPDLVEAVNRTGVSVALEQSGKPPRLDPSVDLTAYRLVQEALTNITRHVGAGARAQVRCATTTKGLLSLEISDNGVGRVDPAVSGLSTGQGLIGLHERVAVVGGHMEAGPSAEGGFRVTATLPVTGLGADQSSRPRTDLGTGLGPGGRRLLSPLGLVEKGGS